MKKKNPKGKSFKKMNPLLALLLAIIFGVCGLFFGYILEKTLVNTVDLLLIKTPIDSAALVLFVLLALLSAFVFSLLKSSHLFMKRFDEYVYNK